MVASIAEVTLKAAVKQRKYVYRVNKNVAIGEVRDLLIVSFCEEDLVRRGCFLIVLWMCCGVMLCLCGLVDHMCGW
jgi:hypothetical protein